MNRSSLVAAAALAVAILGARPAQACGGFFCNQSQPVNQAAEGIIFADNGNGTVTAVIQIQYQGPSQSFSWLLPISSVPDIKHMQVASNFAFQRLQAATNPNYTLTTVVEGSCRQDESRNFGTPGYDTGGSTSLAVGGTDTHGVTVEASGVVGAFDVAVLSISKTEADPAASAVAWLTENKYDVPPSAPQLLGPYLREGLYLLALRLTKGADVGSIRPIVLNYEGTEPSIPLKLTAVAANDDMGVLTWVLGASRAVPSNYRSLQLNEARINWFNANSNYNSVVTEAANDAGGQGFVTEFAGATSTLANTVWTTSDAANWSSMQTTPFGSFSDMFQRAYNSYGAWDGFWDATKAAITKLPDLVTFEDFKKCPDCYSNRIELSPSTYLTALQTNVIEPVQLVQKLIDAHPQMTRMYSTLSADEMTADPLFSFNADAPEVSNQHNARRVIECQPSLYQQDAPWRIELPQGGFIRGAGLPSSTWPDALSTLPPNRLISQSAKSGSGRVLEDNTAMINQGLTSYNKSLPPGAGNPDDYKSSGGCSVSALERGGSAAGFLLLGLGAVLLGRRRR